MQDLSQAVVELHCFTDDACGSVHTTLQGVQGVSDRLCGSGKYITKAVACRHLIFLIHSRPAGCVDFTVPIYRHRYNDKVHVLCSSVVSW